MKTIRFAMTILLVSSAAYGADAKPADTIDAKAAFAKLKSLVGEWQGDGPGGRVRVTYSLTAGGTALLEREEFEKMPEMVTLYHLDGKRLLLTHYCMAGNQPRMEAISFDPAKGEIKFRFLDVTNLASPAAAHMKNATLRILDGQRMSSDWEYFVDGQFKETHGMQLTKVR